MTERVTQRELDNYCKVIQNRYGLPVRIDRQAGRPRVVIDEKPGVRDLSPRDRAGVVRVWLDGMLAGLELAPRRGELHQRRRLPGAP